jgi:hypothetical protein
LRAELVGANGALIKPGNQVVYVLLRALPLGLRLGVAHYVENAKAHAAAIASA